MPHTEGTEDVASWGTLPSAGFYALYLALVVALGMTLDRLVVRLAARLRRPQSAIALTAGADAIHGALIPTSQFLPRHADEGKDSHPEGAHAQNCKHNNSLRATEGPSLRLRGPSPWAKVQPHGSAGKVLRSSP